MTRSAARWWNRIVRKKSDSDVRYFTSFGRFGDKVPCMDGHGQKFVFLASELIDVHDERARRLSRIAQKAYWVERRLIEDRLVHGD